MNDWQVVIPYICPRNLLIGFLGSMGDVTVPILLVDNSPDSYTKRMDLPDGIEVVHYPKNLGVAASWNLGLKRGARWTLVCSACIRFLDGGLSGLIEQASSLATPYGLAIEHNITGPGSISWHLRVVGHATVRDIGYFDENYYPALWEDVDYTWRMQLAGIAVEDVPCHREPRVFIPWLRTRVICVGNTLSTACMDGSRYNYGAPSNYYTAKWGTRAWGQEWDHPFNDPAKGLDWWPEPTGRGRGLNW